MEEVIARQSLKQVNHGLFHHFKKVLLQDSTTIKLSQAMLERFKGNVSGGKQKSVAKVNVVLDVLKGSCPVIELMSFTVNEQKLSDSILAIAKAGDLVIRDLGYFVLPIFKAMDIAKVYFLSRLKFNVCLYDVESGKKINLAQLLKGKTWVDTQVICGKEEQLKVRIVAIKLSAAQAGERRRKAKQDRDQRLKHSEEYFELLGFVIFISNIGKEVWDYRQIAEAYRIRWNIEILFKSWKSCFKIEAMMPEDISNTARIESFIYLLLLYIAWFQLLIFMPFRWMIQQRYNKHLSIIKAAKYVMTNFADWLFEDISRQALKKLAYSCCYDVRHDRTNAVATLEQFYKPLG